MFIVPTNLAKKICMVNNPVNPYPKRLLDILHFVLGEMRQL